MTDETIKDLFYGNLNLFDRPMHRNEEYNTALQVAAEARDALEATMTDEQKKLLDAYVDKHSTVMGFEYRYRSMMVYTYRGYKFRKTQTLGPDGRHIYQINDDPIDVPLERMELTTIAKTKAYIDQLIEKDMATPQTQEDKIDRILDILERVNKIAIEGNQECRIRFDIIIKPKEDTND